MEWLVGKFVNQATSVYRLVRAAQYDEALMLVRGMGEIANLLWLFYEDRTELAAWKVADKKARMNNFGPGAVRRRLEKSCQMGPPIDAERYGALCEIGTHPTPKLAPGHYSGTGRPVLGAILQEIGVFVCVNELAYTIAMAAIPTVVLLDADHGLQVEMKAHASRLLRGMGNFTVLNYEEGLEEVRKRSQTDGASPIRFPIPGIPSFNATVHVKTGRKMDSCFEDSRLAAKFNTLQSLSECAPRAPFVGSWAPDVP